MKRCIVLLAASGLLVSLVPLHALGARLQSISYGVNPVTAGTAANHTIVFRTNTEISSGAIRLYLRNLTSSFGSVGVADIDMGYGDTQAASATTQLTLGADAAVSTWGVALDTTNRFITFTYPTAPDSGSNIPAEKFINIRIGTVASGGVNRMTNSATAGRKDISIVVGTDVHLASVGLFAGSDVTPEATAVTAPIAPTNLTAAGTTSAQTSLLWTDASDNETGFEIQRKITGGNYALIATTAANITTYADTGLAQNTGYVYRVRAINTIGNSDYTTELSVTTAPFSLGSSSQAPALPAALSENSEIVSAPASPQPSVPAQSPKEPDNPVVPKPPAPPPIPPTSFEANATNFFSRGVLLTWSGASNQTLTEIERRLGAGAFARIAVPTTQDASFSDILASQGSRYTYRIKVLNADGAFDYSKEVSVTTPTPPQPRPAAPQELRAILKVQETSSILLNWTDVSTNETGFEIHRRNPKKTTDFSVIGASAANVSEYADTSIQEKTLYDYRVRALNTSGSSAFSNEVQVYSAQYPDPASPLALSPLYDPVLNSVFLTWTYATSEVPTEFSIQRRLTSESAFGASLGLVKTFAYTDRTVEKGASYVYRILAQNPDGVIRFSNEISVTTVPPLPPASLAPRDVLAIADSHQRVTIHWTDMSDNESRFIIEKQMQDAASLWVDQQALPFIAANSSGTRDFSVEPGAQYRYRISAEGAGGRGTSDWVTVTVPLAPVIQTPILPVAPVATPVTLFDRSKTLTARTAAPKKEEVSVAKGAEVATEKKEGAGGVALVIKPETSFFLEGQDVPSEKTDTKTEDQVAANLLSAAKKETLQEVQDLIAAALAATPEVSPSETSVLGLNEEEEKKLLEKIQTVLGKTASETSFTEIANLSAEQITKTVGSLVASAASSAQQGSVLKKIIESRRLIFRSSQGSLSIELASTQDINITIDPLPPSLSAVGSKFGGTAILEEKPSGLSSPQGIGTLYLIGAHVDNPAVSALVPQPLSQERFRTTGFFAWIGSAVRGIFVPTARAQQEASQKEPEAGQGLAFSPDQKEFPISSFIPSLTYTFRYTADEAANVDEKSIKLYSWDPIKDVWTPELSVVDVENRTVIAQIGHLSIFRLFGEGVGIPADQKKDIIFVPSAAIDVIQTEIENTDLGLVTTEEQEPLSIAEKKFYTTPNQEISLCIAAKIFKKSVKKIVLSVGATPYQLKYSAVRKCYAATITTPSERGVQNLVLKVIYVDDQIQQIKLEAEVTSELEGKILSVAIPAALQVTATAKKVNKNVKKTVETTKPLLQTVAVAAVPIVTIANPAILSNSLNSVNYLLHFVSWLLSLLGFRKKRKTWGVVYDAVSKGAIDLVIVRLFDRKTNRLIETQVTDKNGRFSFLTTQGEYYLTAAKLPMMFPSGIVKGSMDGEYLHVYRQETLTVKSADEPIALSIPMDPPASAQYRAGHVPSFTSLKNAFSQLSKASLLIGFIISVLLALYTPSTLNSALLAINWVYATYQVFLMIKKEKPWGTVFDALTLQPVPLAAISIFDARQRRLLRTRLTDYTGRFTFLAPPGDYLLSVSKQSYRFPPGHLARSSFGHTYGGEVLRIKRPNQLLRMNVPIERANTESLEYGSPDISHQSQAIKQTSKPVVKKTAAKK